jgi:hypothetical protein
VDGKVILEKGICPSTFTSLEEIFAERVLYRLENMALPDPWVYPEH